MKKLLLSISAILFWVFGFAQNDTVIIITDSLTVKTFKTKAEPLRINGFAQNDTVIIITDSLTIKTSKTKTGPFRINRYAQNDTLIIIIDSLTAITSKSKTDPFRINGDIQLKIYSRDKQEKLIKKYKRNFKTKRWVLDLGRSNYIDNTNYIQAAFSGQVGSGVNKNLLEVNTRKITNVNLWFFMRKVNLIKNVVNLKYGAGLEMNNYRFNNTGISFQKNPTKILYTPLSEIKKAKLAVDYFTIPMMLNFNLNPKSKPEIGFSAGFSLGYLYSARFKTKSQGAINKIRDDFDLKPFKIAYVGELNILNWFTLYGSYALKNMWNNEFNMTPYSIGLRLNNSRH